MRSKMLSWLRSERRSWVVAGLWFAAVLLFALFAGRMTTAVRLISGVLLAALSLLAVWNNFRDQRARQRESQVVSRRLELVLQLNRSLLDVQDEHQLMDSALATLQELSCAVAASFVSLDEWDQPMPAFTRGNFPQPVLRSWAEHLASQAVRERCRYCSDLEAEPHKKCPLMEGPLGNAVWIYCFPIHQAGRMVGILNLYLPPNVPLPDDTRQLVGALLGEVTVALQSLRLRSQELATIRQVQMVHGSKADLSVRLGELLDGLMKTFDLDVAMAQVRDLENSGSGLTVLRGEVPPVDQQALEAACARLFREKNGEETRNTAGYWLFGLPLQDPQGGGIGALLIASTSMSEFHPRQRELFQAVANQAALLIESERTMLSLEYNAVVQERARLAREIHDGLAQTLALLKLQSSQMQNHLAHGEINRLSELLAANHAALSEAYLDTRQAIDNLRLTPQKGLTAWLEQIAAEFTTSSELPVDCSLAAGDANLLPEVQAQLIRIVQEALTNVRKHAHARRVQLNLRVWLGDLVLEIGDDGVGFSPSDVADYNRVGLRSMRERAELIGADFQIISQPGQGTTVRLLLPAAAEEKTR